MPCDCACILHPTLEQQPCGCPCPKHPEGDARSPHSELVEFIDACERAGDHYGFGSDEFFASARVSVQNLVEQLEATQRNAKEFRHEAEVQQARWLEGREMLEKADAVIALMTDYMDDILDRARGFNESKLQHPEALTGAFPMYVVPRLEELARKVAAITSNPAKRDADD